MSLPLTGFRMPAEWEPHQATWLTWPHDEAHWPGKFEGIPALWARMVKELETGEDVRVIIHDEETERSAKDAMDRAGVIGRRVHLQRIPNNFPWARDHGPIFVKDSSDRLGIVQFKYNAWGNKWAFDLDAKIPEQISKLRGFDRAQAPMVLEGGSIDVNGLGTLLTTESCLLNPNRNPHLSRVQIEQNLRDYLGVSNILWLGDGIAGDDTDGHVDDITRFVAPKTIVTMVEASVEDVNYKPLRENLERLSGFKDQDGRALEIIEIQLPKPVIYEDTRLPASYANFYIGNRVVLLPVFNDPNDQPAIDAFSKLFPTRKVVPLNCRDLVWGLGAFHCATQQEPLSQHGAAT